MSDIYNPNTPPDELIETELNTIVKGIVSDVIPYLQRRNIDLALTEPVISQIVTRRVEEYSRPRETLAEVHATIKSQFIDSEGQPLSPEAASIVFRNIRFEDVDSAMINTFYWKYIWGPVSREEALHDLQLYAEVSLLTNTANNYDGSGAKDAESMLIEETEQGKLKFLTTVSLEKARDFVIGWQSAYQQSYIKNIQSLNRDNFYKFTDLIGELLLLRLWDNVMLSLKIDEDVSDGEV